MNQIAFRHGITLYVLFTRSLARSRLTDVPCCASNLVVTSVNVSSALADAVLEWIARQFPYRLDGNSECARSRLEQQPVTIGLDGERYYPPELVHGERPHGDAGTDEIWFLICVDLVSEADFNIEHSRCDAIRQFLLFFCASFG